MEPPSSPSSQEPRSPSSHRRWHKSKDEEPAIAAPDSAVTLDSLDLDQSLHQIEQSLWQLKARYTQVQRDQQRQQGLVEGKQQLEKQLQHASSAATQRQLKQELKRLRQQLDTVEVALESQLLSWSGWKELFWQAVRFAGLGIVLGWLLRSMVG
jgi:chromosome segregation ATPase